MKKEREDEREMKRDKDERKRIFSKMFQNP